MDPGWQPPLEKTEAFVHKYAPTRMSNLQWRLRRHQDEFPDTDVPALLARAAEQPELTWITLPNGELFFGADGGLTADRPNRHCDTFCTPAYRQRLFPNGGIVDPVAPVRMHCLIIDRASRRC